MIKYSSNNSGGNWPLTDEDWHALEKAGWRVNWIKDHHRHSPDKDGRWLGTLAMDATREGLGFNEATAEFASITGQDVEDEGCECCGPPHSFTEA